jgi:hypothetical protein
MPAALYSEGDSKVKLVNGLFVSHRPQNQPRQSLLEWFSSMLGTFHPAEKSPAQVVDLLVVLFRLHEQRCGERTRLGGDLGENG